jgi:hypothetical protein
MSPKHLPVSGLFLLIIVLFLSFASFSRADEVQLKPDHPERYTVVGRRWTFGPFSEES